tara:strand:- start:738 stop:1163 length:426 start_codon:yes stop_codon:yes gene_type:complete
MAEQKVAFKIDSDYVEKVLEAIPEKKYFDLVWAARKPPLDAPEEVWERFWNDGFGPTPIDIRTKCLKELKRVVETYPDEMKEMRDPDIGAVEYGFNSGCLAMCRWILEVFDNRLHTETDDGEPVPSGGIDKANDNFPSLDT